MAPKVEEQRRVKIPYWTWDAMADTTSKYIAVRGGLGSAKTTNCALIHLDLCFQNAAPPSSPIPSESWAVAQTHGKIEDTLLPAFQERLWEVYGMQPDVHYKVRGGNAGVNITFNHLNHRIVFKSGDRAKLLAGTNITHFLITEAGLQAREVFNRCVQRARSPFARLVRGVIEGTPEDDPIADWYQEWAGHVGYSEELKTRVFEVWTEHNPHLKPSTTEYVEALRRQYAYSPARLEAYLYGRFVRFDADGAYVFRDGRNKLPRDSVRVAPGLPLLFTWDFNRTPLAWAVLQRQPVQNADGGRGFRFVVLKEASGQSRGLMGGVAEFSAHFPPELYRNVPIEVYGDASGHAGSHKVDVSDYSQIEDYLRQLGYHDAVVRAPRSNPRVRARLERTNALLSGGMLVVSDECVNTIGSFVRTTLKKGTMDIAKPAGDMVTHFADAVSYCVVTCTRDENILDPNARPTYGFNL